MDDDRLARQAVDLARLVEKLRGPGGCPWDAKQTDSSVKAYLLEEAYEVLDAIESSSPGEVRDELGDLLFQIFFLAHLAEERGEFDMEDVFAGITRKMVHRHPHVFGETRVSSADEVAMNWAEIKKSEKGKIRDTTSHLQSVPGSLPALLRSHRLSERAAKAGFDWSGVDNVWEKVLEESGELSRAVAGKDTAWIGEEIGDLIFTLVNLARHCGLNAEHLLRLTNRKFVSRFAKMEQELEASGIPLEQASLDQMDKAWEKIKDEKE